MAIILNVEIVLILSSSKGTVCFNKFWSRAHCLLNMCEVLELSQQVCWHTMKRKWGEAVYSGQQEIKRSHVDGL